MELLKKQEIEEFELAMRLICGEHPIPYLDRLCYTARIGAEFIKQTKVKGE